MNKRGESCQGHLKSEGRDGMKELLDRLNYEMDNGARSWQDLPGILKEAMQKAGVPVDCFERKKDLSAIKIYLEAF